MNPRTRLSSRPRYRGASAKLFKHPFDLVDDEALEGLAVLLAAEGGCVRHAVVIEHQLRPLFAFFRAITVRLGVYVTDANFLGGRIVAPDLEDRMKRAVTSAMPLVLPAVRVPPRHGCDGRVLRLRDRR